MTKRFLINLVVFCIVATYSGSDVFARPNECSALRNFFSAARNLRIANILSFHKIFDDSDVYFFGVEDEGGNPFIYFVDGDKIIFQKKIEKIGHDAKFKTISTVDTTFPFSNNCRSSIVNIEYYEGEAGTRSSVSITTLHQFYIDACNSCVKELAQMKLSEIEWTNAIIRRKETSYRFNLNQKGLFFLIYSDVKMLKKFRWGPKTLTWQDY